MTPPNSSQGGENEGSGATRKSGQPAGAPSGLSPQAVSSEAAHQAQHTPGPWADAYEDEMDGIPMLVIETDQPIGPKLRNICEVSATYTDSDHFVLDDEARANAAFIVRACNSHDDLVEALSFYVIICGNTAASVDRQSAREAYTRAAAALAKARGEVA